MVVIPKTVTKIADNAFNRYNGVPVFLYIIYQGTATEFEAVTKGSNWNDGQPTTMFMPDITIIGDAIEYGEEHTDHVLKFRYNYESHWQVCVLCGYIEIEKTEHTFTATPLPEDDGARDSSHKLECECGYSKTGSHNPDEDTKYTQTTDENDEPMHSYICECGQTISKRCEGEYISEEAEGHHLECKTCGNELSATEAHEFDIYGNFASDGGAYHWPKCDYCGYGDESRQMAHTHGTTASDVFEDPDNPGNHYFRCTGCKMYVDSEAHTLTPKSDLLEHWKVCDVCKNTYDKGAHTFGDDKKCTGCDYTLEECTHLDIQDGVLKGRGQCDHLIIIVPDTVTEIAKDAFHTAGQYKKTDNLTAVYIPASVTKIGGSAKDSGGVGAFDFCSDLKTVIIKGSPIIEAYAFNKCSITYLEIGENTIIEEYAFNNGLDLSTLVLGKNVTGIKNVGINKTTITIIFNGTVADWQEFIEANSSWSWLNMDGFSNVRIQCNDGVADKDGNQLESN